MSTQAIYTFKQAPDDGGRHFHVFAHWDGYPSGAAAYLREALTLAWKLPHYEADAFAASFVVAVCKLCAGPGCARLVTSADDIAVDYHYEIDQPASHGGALWIVARRGGEILFSGLLDDFFTWATAFNPNDY